MIVTLHKQLKKPVWTSSAKQTTGTKSLLFWFVYCVAGHFLPLSHLKRYCHFAVPYWRSVVYFWQFEINYVWNLTYLLFLWNHVIWSRTQTGLLKNIASFVNFLAVVSNFDKKKNEPSRVYGWWFQLMEYLLPNTILWRIKSFHFKLKLNRNLR